MADSIHDQWPEATGEWSQVTGQFLAAWVGVFAAYNVNSDYAFFAAAIGYLSRMHQDTTVMAGDMITHIAQTGGDAARGTVTNFQNLQSSVFPQWGVLAANYAETRAQAWTAHEAVNRVNADNAEAAARALGDAFTRQYATDLVTQESAARALGDAFNRTYTDNAVAAEAVARAAGDDHSRQQAAAGDAAVETALTAQINVVLQYAQSIPGLIDQRAAAGYDPTLQARANLLTKLLDTVVAHDPAVASLVSDLAKFVIDLAGIEDPVLRIAAQLVLKQVIDRLGLNTALQAILSDLIGSILGGGQPKTLTTIMGDIGNRLDSLEKGVSELSPLAPEADQLHELGSIIFDAALLAYLVAAVADPVATANDTVDVLAPITTPLLAPIRALLGM